MRIINSHWSIIQSSNVLIYPLISVQCPLSVYGAKAKHWFPWSQNHSKSSYILVHTCICIKANLAIIPSATNNLLFQLFPILYMHKHTQCKVHSAHKKGKWVLLYCIESLDLLVWKKKAALTSGSIAITAIDYNYCFTLRTTLKELYKFH